MSPHLHAIPTERFHHARPQPHVTPTGLAGGERARSGTSTLANPKHARVAIMFHQQWINTQEQEHLKGMSTLSSHQQRIIIKHLLDHRPRPSLEPLFPVEIRRFPWMNVDPSAHTSLHVQTTELNVTISKPNRNYCLQERQGRDRATHPGRTETSSSPRFAQPGQHVPVASAEQTTPMEHPLMGSFDRKIKDEFHCPAEGGTREPISCPTHSRQHPH